MRRAIVLLAAACGCAGGSVVESDAEWMPGPGVGDSSTTGPEPVFDERPVERAEGVPPISGGTLVVLQDGNTVVAADPDRDLVHVAGIAPPQPLATIALQAGDEPGRAVEDDGGLFHVVLRGAAALVSIDTGDWSIVARHATCANPRGVAWDAVNARVVVACAGGELVFHPPGDAISARIHVADDLRDVLVADGTIRVSRFRNAELLTLADDGSIAATERPIMIAGRLAGTAWRTVATPDGGWLMVHQASSTVPIPLSVPEYYDGGAGCFGPVGSMIALAGRSGLTRSPLLEFATLAVDGAMSPDGTKVAIAVAGQSDAHAPNVQRTRGVIVLPTDPLWSEGALAGDCTDPDDIPIPGQPVAVAWVDATTLVAQSREPAALFVMKDGGQVAEIVLEGGPRRDTGHDLFHQDASTGIACASCHPEGGADGRVWGFVTPEGELLPRRTQSMRAGLAGTEPFHWSGEMDDFDAIADEIHARRMGAARQTPERLDAFERWIFSIAPDRREHPDDAQSERGRTIFVARCASCHGEDGLLGNRTVEIGAESFQVPSLRGVGLRAPYMHDGRAVDLRDAIVDMLALTPDATLGTAEIDDLVAFLQTL